MFKKAGISKPPVTWSELLTDVAKFKSRGAYGYVFQSDSDYAMSYEAVGPYIKAAKGDVLMNSGATAKADAADSSGTVGAVGLLQKIVAAGATPPGESHMTADAMAQLFAQGKVAMMTGGPWQRPAILKTKPKAKYGVDFATAPIPVPVAGDKSASASGGWQIGVFATSHHQAAALKLLGWMTARAHIITLAAAGSFPPLTNGLDSKPWSSDPFYTAYRDVLPSSGLPITPVPQLPQVSQVFEQTVLPTLLQHKPVKTQLTAFDKQVNEQVLQR